MPYSCSPLNVLWLAQPHRSCLFYGQCLFSRSVIHSRFGIRCSILCIWVVFLLTRTHFIAAATTSTNSTAGWLTTSGSHFQLAGTSCFIVGSQGVRYCIYLMSFNRFQVLRPAHQWATPYSILSRSYGYWTLYQINNFLFILYYYYTCFLWFCQQVLLLFIQMFFGCRSEHHYHKHKFCRDCHQIPFEGLNDILP